MDDAVSTEVLDFQMLVLSLHHALTGHVEEETFTPCAHFHRNRMRSLLQHWMTCEETEAERNGVGMRIGMLMSMQLRMRMRRMMRMRTQRRRFGSTSGIERASSIGYLLCATIRCVLRLDGSWHTGNNAIWQAVQCAHPCKKEVYLRLPPTGR